MHSKKLADTILNEFEEISFEFSSFQEKNQLGCFSGCGKCCFKSDISCSPMELLPLAHELLERGEAERFYDLALNKKGDQCMFLEIHDEEKGLGKCLEYKHRPLVCRSFGVAARKDKNNQTEFSVCKPLKEKKTLQYENLVNGRNLDSTPMPYIEVLSGRLSIIDPGFFEKQLPINESLVIVLEKVLMHNLFTSEQSLN